MDVGTLTDTDILHYAENRKLIIDNFERGNVKQACYELRAGNIYFDLSAGCIKHTVNDEEYIVFRPHQTIVVISKEKFQIPEDILARFLTKGYLVSLGLTPVNTYADPGFYGQMGMIMTNTSNEYLKIQSGDTIAKVEFCKLHAPVKECYHGQHGFETQIWPFRKELIINRKDLRNYIKDFNEFDEIEAAFGKAIAQSLKRIYVTEHRFLFATIILIIVDLIIIGFSQGTKWLSPVMSVILGIVSNVVYAIVASVISKNTK